MITFLNILISSSIIPKSDLICPIIRLVMSQYQLLLSQKVTSLCPIIHLVMTQISTSPVPKKNTLLCPIIHLKETKNQLLLSQKNHLVQSQNLSRYDHKSISPVPKSDIVLSHISSHYDVISTSPVPKVTLFCLIICLVMAQYHILLSQKVTLFVP